MGDIKNAARYWSQRIHLKYTSNIQCCVLKNDSNIVIDLETNKEINRCDNTHMRPEV